MIRIRPRVQFTGVAGGVVEGKKETTLTAISATEEKSHLR